MDEKYYAAIVFFGMIVLSVASWHIFGALCNIIVMRFMDWLYARKKNNDELVFQAAQCVEIYSFRTNNRPLAKGEVKSIKTKDYTVTFKRN